MKRKDLITRVNENNKGNVGWRGWGYKERESMKEGGGKKNEYIF